MSQALQKVNVGRKEIKSKVLDKAESFLESAKLSFRQCWNSFCDDKFSSSSIVDSSVELCWRFHSLSFTMRHLVSSKVWLSHTIATPSELRSTTRRLSNHSQADKQILSLVVANQMTQSLFLEIVPICWTAIFRGWWRCMVDTSLGKFAHKPQEAHTAGA